MNRYHETFFLADPTFGATFDGYFEEIHFKAPSVVNFFLLSKEHVSYMPSCLWWSNVWAFSGRCVQLPAAAVSGGKHENGC